MVTREVAQAVDIRPTTVQEFRLRTGDMLLQHWAQIMVGPLEWMPRNPNWEHYQQLEDRGCLVALAAWEGEDMIGYAVGCMFQHPYSKDMKALQHDLLFVTPAMRGMGLGMRLMRELEQAGREAGCEPVFMHAKPGSAMSRILERAGYEVIDEIRGKRL